jgi:hypothetical protein
MIEKNAILFNEFLLDPLKFVKKYDSKAVEKYYKLSKQK